MHWLEKGVYIAFTANATAQNSLFKERSSARRTERGRKRPHVHVAAVKGGRAAGPRFQPWS